MKIIFTSSGEGWDAKIDPRFGRTDYILLYNEETEELSSIDNREIQDVAHGAGPNAAAILNKMPLKIYIKAGGMTIHEAYEAYKNNKLYEGE